MSISDLIKKLEDALKLNGDIPVEGIVEGKIIHLVDINCPDDESPLYLDFLSEYK